ncbi:MAG: hypothetical protein RJB58_297 [Pseudomonadota bacterium]
MHDTGLRKALLLVVAPLFLLALLSFMYRTIVRGGRAVWIANGTLYIGASEMPVTDVQDVRIGDFHHGAILVYRERSIVVKLRDGTECPIDNRYLTEPVPVVLARLREALGLPKARG